jgi:hypothetical protein
VKTAAWHLEQAAIHQQLADRHARRGFHHDAEVERLKAVEHRERALVLARLEAAA